MILCPLCGYKFPVECKPEASNDDFGIVRALSNRQLLRGEHYQYLAKRLVDVPGSSREVPNWIAKTIWEFPGTILGVDGNPFKPTAGEIDRAFGKDKTFRWIRSFRASAGTLPAQIPQERLLDRLRLIDLAFRVADFHPGPKN